MSIDMRKNEHKNRSSMPDHAFMNDISKYKTYFFTLDAVIGNQSLAHMTTGYIVVHSKSFCYIKIN